MQFDGDEIAQVAAALAKLAKEAQSLVDQLNTDGFTGKLETDGARGMYSGLKHVSRWLGDLGENYRSTWLPSPGGPRGGSNGSPGPRPDGPKKPPKRGG